MANTQLTFSKTKDKVITTYKKAEEKLGLLFIVIVIIPTLCSIIYFCFWASDVLWLFLSIHLARFRHPRTYQLQVGKVKMTLYGFTMKGEVIKMLENHVGKRDSQKPTALHRCKCHDTRSQLCCS